MVCKFIIVNPVHIYENDPACPNDVKYSYLYLMIQQVVIYVLLGLALAYLAYKLFRPKKKTGCDTDCGGH